MGGPVNNVNINPKNYVLKACGKHAKYIYLRKLFWSYKFFLFSHVASLPYIVKRRQAQREMMISTQQRGS